MSYTKFSKAVTKWLKANGLPCYGTAYHPHKALNQAIAQHLRQGDLQENLDRL